MSQISRAGQSLIPPRHSGCEALTWYGRTCVFVPTDTSIAFGTSRCTMVPAWAARDLVLVNHAHADAIVDVSPPALHWGCAEGNGGTPWRGVKRTCMASSCSCPHGSGTSVPSLIACVRVHTPWRHVLKSTRAWAQRVQGMAARDG